MAADKAPEVRLNDDGSLDEVVGEGFFHLEQMDTGHWWMAIHNAAGEVHINLESKRKITASFHFEFVSSAESNETRVERETESLRKDAERYRKLRSLALNGGSLEATVALGQFDFIATAELFDAAVDATPDAQ